MIFRKHSKVEVWSKREESSASWFPAQIIWGNEQYYHVQYDHPSQNGLSNIDVVQSCAVRPYPPQLNVPMNCVVGDIVEVYVDNSWRDARVLSVLDGGIYYILFVAESSKSIRVHNANVRLRQSWQGGRWVLLDRESTKQTEEDDVANKSGRGRLMSERERAMKVEFGRRHAADPGFGKQARARARDKAHRKARTNTKKVNARNPYGAAIRKTKKLPESAFNWNSKVSYDDVESVASSVGSCSDSESSLQSSDQNMECDHVNEKTHQLELNAYCSTIKALHQCGPLTWKREALLADLGIMLHITNDEHLMMLRHLRIY